MRIRFHPRAQRELAEAARWYEQRRAGSAQSYAGPCATPRGSSPPAPPHGRAGPDLPDVRFYAMSRFTFVLPYFGDEAQIAVLAVAHVSRRPGYRQARLRDL
jgi:plasmid stabilization system protein ParE